MNTQEKQTHTEQTQEHIRKMKLKYADMMLSGLSMLEDAGLKPTFAPQNRQKGEKR